MQQIRNYKRFIFKTLKYFRIRYRKISNPVIIYQMGKVASTSIYSSLLKIDGIDVFHVHRMDPLNIENVRSGFLRRGLVPPNEMMGLYLYKRLIKPRSVPVRLITSVREPIARNISAYFENLDLYEKVVNAHNVVDIERLIDGFLRNYDHNVPLDWFDVEMFSTTGIDVYKYKFPYDRGYQVINEPPFSLLILYHDLDDSVKENCIKAFLNIKDIRILRQNEASSKEYSEVYREFLHTITFPGEYVERMLSSKYAGHFYPPEKLELLRKKWTRKENW